ncbi:fusaric acid resistance family protein [Georgenia soli]|uniref:Fusaric acid resistance family protein n=1 Tax=Georgenia soli TaxID=638953 RepID=A0A2A9EI57_9MICO|nr:FUSC family protein [Georgenia soli]PFG38201.1 fusaric acid resistance family protein [Georgenia soli]
MGDEASRSFLRRLLGAAVLLFVAVGVPMLATLPLGVEFAAPAVLVAAFSLVLSMNAGWRRTLAAAPAMVVASALTAWTGGSGWWVLVIALLGVCVGLAARYGWAAAAVLVGFVASGMAPAEDVSWTRLAVMAAAALYAVAVARALHLPESVPGVSLPWRQALIAAGVFGAVTGLAALVARAVELPIASWLPATAFILVLPTAELTLGQRAVHRVAGTALGALVAVAIGAVPLVRGLAASLALLALLLCLVFPRPLWRSAAFATTAVMLLLGSTMGTSAAAAERVWAVVVAVVLVLLGAALAAGLARIIPHEAAEVAADGARARRREVEAEPAG